MARSPRQAANTAESGRSRVSSFLFFFVVVVIGMVCSVWVLSCHFVQKPAAAFATHLCNNNRYCICCYRRVQAVAVEVILLPFLLQNFSQ